MQSSAQSGYLLLADISGYTSFMAGTELEHSQEILGEILRLLVAQLTPTLDLAEVEGDAVFVYSPEKRLGRGETLLELIETAYVAFRNKREFMRAGTTCICKACAAIPTLDLKFITHYGEFILQDITGKQKPVGSAVNLSHRLLKNSVSEATGWKAYALFTEGSLTKLNVQPEGMHEEVETYEHLGNVKTRSMDLHARYVELNKITTVLIKPEEAHDSATLEYAAPPAVVWEWIIDHEKRNLLGEGKLHWSTGLRPGGRTGLGATSHCAHGKASAPGRER